MRTLVKLSGIVAVAIFAAAQASAQTTNALWTFEVSLPTTAGPYSPEVGSGAATGFHSGATVYSNPVGDGSAESYSANGWSVGDYWQFQVNTTGYMDIQLSWAQVSSSTGPKDFKLQYSTDGSSFTDFMTYGVRSNAFPAWTSASSSGLDTFMADLSAISALDNDSSVYFRLVDTSTAAASGGTVAATGTDRIDNVLVTSTVIPEPSTVALAALGLVGLLALRRRK